ncbi:MAG TPA: hypothetical protein VL242_17385 [Sorangium sp.]|nr:hypothetical protein [Sorangium sp.]
MPSDVLGWTADRTCGVFVSATASDGGDGTPEAPLKTLAEAIQIAAQREDETARRVYACAEKFEETVTVTAGVTIHGGLDCKADWQWDRAKTTILTTSPGAVPLTMSAEGGTVHLENIHVIAQSTNTSDPGTSAIAVIAERCEVEVVRCTFEAGHAAPGAPGARPSPQREQVDQGTRGKAACSADAVVTEPPLSNDCGTADTSDDSSGGQGGFGLEDRGGRAFSGSPGAEAYPNGGLYNTEDGTCSDGTTGRNGDPGMPGAGARGIGQLSNTGYTGTPGRDGQSGKTAQGGGGGAGSHGNADACPGSANGGASGGNGGAGGCGGEAGKGGSPGGSSIALLSLDAKLTFSDVRLIAGKGGKGGDGGVGQAGQLGGDGGRGGSGSSALGLRAGCAGGMGGQGGTGGRGGGGQGGHSLGIAFQGTPDNLPSLDRAVVQRGEAGPGGEGSDDEHDGDAGKASDLLDFSPPQRAPAP